MMVSSQIKPWLHLTRTVPGEGYIPEYMRTDITDRLHDEFGFRTDYQIISKKNMKKILIATKH